jgi:predicted ATP-grasp superfamily ATP-dependent carboligase
VWVLGAPRDLILVQGPEPSMRWRSFTRHIVDLAEALGTQLVVTIGALLTDVPHTWPVPITGLASDEALVRKLALAETTYEGPTGIVGVLHTACAEAGMPSASLWASVPRYLPGGPNPKAALALVRAVEGLVAVAVDASDLELASSEFERQIGLAVESNPKARAIVENLEQAIGEETRALEPDDLPSGDVLAREIQRFLRQQEPDR